MNRRILFFWASILSAFLCIYVSKKGTAKEDSASTDIVIEKAYIPVSNHGKLYYEVAGQGEPILFLHGHSLDHRMWDDQFLFFAQYYRVIRPDFRGYGLSSEQTEDFQFTHVDDIITLMDSLHISKAHIVGLSMGSFVTGDMLGLYSDRMLSSVMASGSVRSCPGPSQPMGVQEAARRDSAIAELQRSGIENMKASWIEQLICSGGSQRERMREPLTQMINDWSAWQPLHKEVRLFYGYEANDSIQSHQPDVPVLMLQGRCEIKGEPKRPRILQYLPLGQWKVLDDCGHMMNMEQPKMFNDTVLLWLRETR